MFNLPFGIIPSHSSKPFWGSRQKDKRSRAILLRTFPNDCLTGSNLSQTKSGLVGCVHPFAELVGFRILLTGDKATLVDEKDFVYLLVYHLLTNKNRTKRPPFGHAQTRSFFWSIQNWSFFFLLILGYRLDRRLDREGRIKGLILIQVISQLGRRRKNEWNSLRPPSPSVAPSSGRKATVPAPASCQRVDYASSTHPIGAVGTTLALEDGQGLSVPPSRPAVVSSVLAGTRLVWDTSGGIEQSSSYEALRIV